MTTVRIAHAEPRPGKLSTGGFDIRGFLVVLADDAGHRAVPIWMTSEPGAGDLSELLGSADEIVTATFGSSRETRSLARSSCAGLAHLLALRSVTIPVLGRWAAAALAHFLAAGLSVA